MQGIIYLFVFLIFIAIISLVISIYYRKKFNAVSLFFMIVIMGTLIIVLIFFVLTLGFFVADPQYPR